jgi:hypothetical protein
MKVECKKCHGVLISGPCLFISTGQREPSSASGSEDDDGSRSNEDGDDDEHDSKRRFANY